MTSPIRHSRAQYSPSIKTCCNIFYSKTTSLYWSDEHGTKHWHVDIVGRLRSCFGVCLKPWYLLISYSLWCVKNGVVMPGFEHASHWRRWDDMHPIDPSHWRRCDASSSYAKEVRPKSHPLSKVWKSVKAERVLQGVLKRVWPWQDLNLHPQDGTWTRNL